MTDLDGELERLRAEARHRLESESKAEPVEAAPPRELERTGELADAESPPAFSTPKLLASLAATLVLGLIIQRLAGPIITVAVIAVLLVLGWRFFKWLGSEREDD